jgi:hypothetical protein
MRRIAALLLTTLTAFGWALTDCAPEQPEVCDCGNEPEGPGWCYSDVPGQWCANLSLCPGWCQDIDAGGPPYTPVPCDGGGGG